MGIDFSHSDAHWSYSGFNNFRTRVAKSIGVDLDAMDGFKRDETPGIPWSTVNDPVVPFLDHSDCDGKLTATECGSVGPRLLEIVNSWGDDVYEYDRRVGKELAESMIDCASNGDNLNFR